MYRTASNGGSTAGVGKKIWEQFGEDPDTLLSSYEAVENEIAYITEQIKTFGDNPAMKEQRQEAEDYLAVLRQIQEAALLDPNNSLFNFMDKNVARGYSDSFDSYLGSIEKVQSALSSLNSNEYIGYQDFYNMMDFLNTQGQWDAFATKVGIAGTKYEDFVNSVVKNTDKWGQVNIAGIAAEMGVSVDVAMDAMKGSMTEGLKKVAQQQIKYLSGLEAMLKAIVALEAIGKLKLSMDIELEDGSIIKISEVADKWKELSENDPNRQLILDGIVNFVTKVDGADAGKDLMSALGFANKSIMDIFFGGSIGEEDIPMADMFGTLIEQIPNMTSGQVEALGMTMRSALSGYLLTDDKGDFIGLKDGWQQALLASLKDLDYSAIPDVINSEVSAAASDAKVTEISVNGAKLTFGENGITFDGDNLEENKEALIAEIQKQLGIAVSDIQLGENGEVFLVRSSTTAQAETLTAEFDSIEEAAQGVVTALSQLQNILDAFQVSEAFKEFASIVASMYGNPGSEDASTDMGMQVAIDSSAALVVLNDFKTAYELMVAAIAANPVRITTVGGSVNGTTVTTGGEQQQQQTGGDSGASAETVTKVSQIISVTYETTNDPPTVTTPQDINYYWKPQNVIPNPSAKQVSFSWKTDDPLEKWYTTSTPLIVNFKWNAIGSPGEPPAAWTGTMNNISGRALADGSIGRMYSGAQLAQKTLVGELGPELAVYNGEYHMLGANGAEFVNLPSDAIVFNHLQTAGIMSGQMNIRGSAMAEGNVHGPALAGGASEALRAVQRAKSVWQGLLNALSITDLLSNSGGGGGGSDESIQAHTAELQEWYNLSRQIADIEQRINNLLKERANIPQRDGEAYLRSLRQEQSLLQNQVDTQKTLLEYQKLQLQRQADHINDPNSIWSQFIEVDANGLLQYKKGNETNGGKGALEVLQELNQMSGEKQVEYLESIGYSYTDVDGNVLEGTELVAKFYEELQEQIDTYDALYDTVNETEGKLEELATSIEEVNITIKENQMELEEEIYNTLIEAWEAEIEALEEQKDLIEEANEAYIDGLKDALQTERDIYSEQERTADREKLQRQLSLLRRSGGSASEIASLEEQLDGLLKEEYFNKQEQLIEDISKASDEQIRKLDEQIRLEEEALDYQKENGVLWSKVYEIMSGSKEDIVNWMQGNAPGFFGESALTQEKMLTEWAHKVGIFTENRKYEEYDSYAKEQLWDNGAIWSQEGMEDYKSIYEGLSDEGKANLRTSFSNAYANARLAGDDHDTAMKKARESIQKNLADLKDVDDAGKKDPPTTGGDPTGFETWYVAGPGKLNLRKEASKSSTSLGQYEPGTAMKVLKKEGDWYKVEVGGKTGWVMAEYLTQTKPGSEKDDDDDSGNTTYRRMATVTYVNADGTTGTVTGKGVDASKWTAEQIALRYAKGKIPAGGTYQSVKYSSYSKGGLVDYTGLALVHGKPGQPEAFLNAKQTALISEAVKSVGDGGALDSIKATLAALNNTIKSITNNNNNVQTSSFTVAPGAVTIQVAELKDSYDVEELSKDVMNRMVAIASKSTNRGVNRR